MAVATSGVALLSGSLELGTCVVAAGWLLHRVWDLVYLKLDKVVARSFGEWCAVIDTLIAVQLVMLVDREGASDPSAVARDPVRLRS
jgi:hypothetical protein